MYVKCLALLLLLLVYLAASMGPKTKMSGGEIDVLQVDREAVSLQCHKNLQPLNGARWTKDGGPVDEANERVDTPGSFLTIEPVYPQDEGVYRCNDGEELRLRVPPHVIGEETVLVMHELGSSFDVPCGIELGPVSRYSGYEVRWQRVFNGGNSIDRLSSCTQTSQLPATQNCNSTNYNPEDFSIAIHNFTASREELDKMQATFKCIVDQFEPPDYTLPITIVDTVISFQYVPAAVTTPLPPYTVIKEGGSVELEIEFSGFPLTPGGIRWRINDRDPLPRRSLSSETATSSSLLLTSDRVETGDTVTATVDVLNNSSFASSKTTLIVLSAIQDFQVTRPSGCDGAPVLSLNIPAPIPVPQDLIPVTLHIELTVIDQEPSHSSVGTTAEGGTTGVFNKTTDAGDLTQSTHLELELEELPYLLLQSMVYVIRVRLEVCGVVSGEWSHYSHPLCVICKECLNPPGLQMHLQFNFPENSYACKNMELGIDEESLVDELVEAIQASCQPRYLCLDLTLSDVTVSCSERDEREAVLTALASGVSSEASIRNFLNSTSGTPFNLSVNGLSIEVTSFEEMADEKDETTSQSAVDGTEIAVTSGSGGLAVVVMVTALMLTCVVWRCYRRRRRRHCNGNESEGSQEPEREVAGPETRPQPTPLPPPPQPLNLGIPPRFHNHPSTLSPPQHCYQSHCCRHTHSFTRSPITMTQAGELVQNLYSPEGTGSTYADTSFMSGVPSYQYGHTPLPGERQLPRNLYNGWKEAHSDKTLPLLLHASTSRRGTPTRSPSPSTVYSWLPGSPSRSTVSALAVQYRRAGSPSSSSSSSSISHSGPPSVLHDSHHYSHHYYHRQWSNRDSPQPYLHGNKQARQLESPV